MDGYGFASTWSMLACAAWPLLLIAAARWLEGRAPDEALALARLLPPIAVGIAAWLVDREAAGTRMLVLVASLFAAMKACVLAASRAGGAPALAGGDWYAFTLLWPGMDPALFARRRRGGRGEALRLAGRGLRNAALGIAIVLAVRALDRAWLAPALMVGGSLAVHFGLFTLLCALFRFGGRAVRLPFDAPHRARSLGEFWALRWNHGFAEMTALLVQRPLAHRLGRRTALLLSFLASGILHEVAISLPVRQGFGGPTAYFVLHGALVAWLPPRHGRIVALLAVVLPLPLLFHADFVRGVIAPLL